ncbi:MerR family transcriptional regulator [Chromobacterium alkanivorans]|uniref:MerR family transcriptional regulator n=1 Tax=Chromobacterium TaxID=535 RepID=UPI0006547398|nr:MULTISPECIES: MerR family transcriptional regulator [Chromobacterium]KMN81076.1 MerR family transcriptional regulator [Chromobacterium sp. LK11]MBN3003097.1 MerR family transcriptional regulator [Chromobacterium alkanivorans]
MKIGELAKRCGMTASRIRFYEASGLIRAVARGANGYRDYGPETLRLLEVISSAQNAGFSLDEIRRLLPTAPNAWRHEELLAGLKRKVDEIELLQQRLEQNKAQLRLVIASMENGPEELACEERAQWVLNRLREDDDAAG